MTKKLVYILAGMFISFLSIQAQSVEEIQQLFADDGDIEDYFGSAISISGDYAIVGASYDDDSGNNAGAAYIFYNNSGTWVQQSKLIASDGESNDYFGLSLVISGDFAFIGAFRNGNNLGAVYVFENISETWTETAKLTASDGMEGDLFGYSIATEGDYTVICSYNDDNIGAAYVFQNISGTWTETAKLLADDVIEGDNFAHSLSISGDYIIAGAASQDGNDVYTGASYIFYNNAGTWTQTAKVTASDATAYDYFGNAVSISGDYVAIGAYSDSPNNILGAGSVYIFYNNAGVWEEQSKLIASDAYQYAWFGSSVSISSDNLVVGATGEIFFTPHVEGSAYIFHNNSGTWTEAAKLLSSDIGTEDEFGYAVYISGDFAIVGGPRNDTNGEDVGSAYIYCTSFPEIITQPISQEDVTLGTDITFNIVAEGTNLTYQWRKNELNLSNGGNINGATTSELLITSVTAYDIGTYDCKVTGDCGSTISNDALLSIITGVKTLSDNEFSIFPNPTVGIINFKFATNTIKRIIISNLTGKTILEKTEIKQNEIIDLSNFKSGIYIISIQTEKEILKTKIIKR